MTSYVYDSLHPYQRTGAHFMRRAGSAVLTDQPGLGKTIQTLGAIIATAAMEEKRWTDSPQGVPPEFSADHVRWHLIVTPKVAIHNVWRGEITRWLKDKAIEVVTLDGTLAQRNALLASFVPKPGTEHVFVVGNIEVVRIKPVEDTYSKSWSPSRKEILRFSRNVKGRGRVKMAYVPENAHLPALFEREWDTIVCDESHRALIRTSGVPTQTRAGFVLLKSRRRLALSGTPMRGKPEQLWGTLNWLRPDLYPAFWPWVKEFFAITSNGHSDYVIGGITASGEHRLAESLKGIMLRRTKAEVAPELPAKTYAGAYVIEGDESSPLGVWLDMEPKQKAQYDRLVTEALIGGSPVNGPLAEYTRQRQIAGAYHDVMEIGEDVRLTPVVVTSPKFEWLKEWLEQNDGEKVVVVSQFTSLLARYEFALAEMGYSVGAITGKVSDKKRDAAVKGFQEGTIQVMLLNTQAGGVALTLDAADYLVFLDETTIPDDQEQAEDRIHRISRVHNVTIYVLRTKDTIEEEVAYIAAARQNVQRYILDGARGVDYAKQVYLQSRADAAKPTNMKASQR